MSGLPADTNQLVLYAIIGFVGIWIFWQLFKPKRRGRERPDDALLKLVADFKASAKQNRESEIRYIKFQGDTKVYRKTRYRLRGIIPDSRCYVFGFRTRLLAFTKIVLVPTELCTFLNSTEVSVRARGVQRWNSLLWFVILTERDQDNAIHFENVVHDYLKYAMDNQFRIELRNITFGNWHESAAGTEYQDFVRRTERMPQTEVPEKAPPKEEVV